MKVILDVQDNKLAFFLELLKNLKFVKANPVSEEKALFLKEFAEAVQEVNEIKAGKRKVRNAKDFLNEL